MNKDIFQRFEEWFVNLFLDGFDYSRWSLRAIILKKVSFGLIILSMIWMYLISICAYIGGNMILNQLNVNYYLGGNMTPQVYIIATTAVTESVLLTDKIFILIPIIFICLILYFIIRYECRRKKDEL